MSKEIKEENKKNQKKGETPNSQGEIFYEAISATAVAPQEIHLPRISVKTADFIESIVIFSVGTALVLLLIRVVLMTFGIGGGNLLTYLLYAASYPFVLILNSGQGQIPTLTSNILYENVAIMVMYLVIAYLAIRLIRAMKTNSKEEI